MDMQIACIKTFVFFANKYPNAKKIGMDKNIIEKIVNLLLSIILTTVNWPVTHNTPPKYVAILWEVECSPSTKYANVPNRHADKMSTKEVKDP